MVFGFMLVFIAVSKTRELRFFILFRAGFLDRYPSILSCAGVYMCVCWHNGNKKAVFFF